MRNLKKYLSSTLLVLTTLTLISVTGCKEVVGPEGEQGPQGEVGPVGPAGEDGSVMYAGPGAPTADIGKEGDYYLNTNTGEYYGPKDEDGWGNPIIVLMGEDGSDGEDGKDGSQIHSGTGAPDSSLGIVGDFYIDLTNQNLYGPKTDNGWGNPISLNGEDGDDGSQIHAGDGPPDASLGVVGDYYLDQTNKALYGPKTENGWGNPIDLSGEDGQDGTDGQDGEDGSQIYSGMGTPAASLGVVGDYYLDKSSYDLYGPKTDLGWGSPINIKGADGNANVTRYIFPGHDFTVDSDHSISITVDNADESAWVVYLMKTDANDIDIYYHMPGWGYGGNTQYSVFHYFNLNLRIRAEDGPGEEYDQIKVVRIESSSTNDHTKQQSEKDLIPETLDLTNYKEVADYYGFGNN
ncbi:hypothetical protein [Gracilimonas tropica]|uniref:hypothetical protein n=1 Tax=Gracilimonas tropica TaxID=454600 RepID=UPI000361CCCA|nr:hypothetical protein [Gracilimonas tropica]